MLCSHLLYNSVSQLYTHISLSCWASPPSPHPSVITELQAEVPVLYSSFSLAVCYTHGSVYMSTLKDFFPHIFSIMKWRSEVASVVSNSLLPHGLQPARLLCPWRISQARILEWVAISFSRRSSRSRTWPQHSWISGRFLTIWATTPQQRTSTFIGSWWEGVTWS